MTPINMKRIIICALCVAACVSCGTRQYSIVGTYTAPDGTETVMIDRNTDDTLAVTTVKDNTFSFSGKITEPAYVYIGHANVKVYSILEPGTVFVDLDERSVQGTPLIDIYMDFNKRFYRFDAERNQERKALEARQDSMSPKEFSDRWDSLNQKYASLQAALADSLIQRWPDNILSGIVLGDLAVRDTALFMRRYSEATEKVKSVRDAKNAYRSISVMSRTAPGKMFLDYTVKGGNPDGTDVSLSDYVGKGKYILLDHWASWCGPCKAEIPSIRKAYDAFKGERFDVVSVAMSDRREDTEKALQELDMPWHQILDAQKIPVELYGIEYIPHLILFAPDGTILKRGLRGEQIYAMMQDLLQD